jgi:hypothetical protein
MAFNAFYAIKNLFGANVRFSFSVINSAVEIGNVLKKSLRVHNKHPFDMIQIFLFVDAIVLCITDILI